MSEALEVGAPNGVGVAVVEGVGLLFGLLVRVVVVSPVVVVEVVVVVVGACVAPADGAGAGSEPAADSAATTGIDSLISRAFS